jgi:hypothetical protein
MSKPHFPVISGFDMKRLHETKRAGLKRNAGG